MIVPSRTALLGVLTVAPLLLPTKGDCQNDRLVMSMDSNIQAFFVASEFFEPDNPMLPNFCEGLGGDVDYDFLTYTATETCAGGFFSEEVTEEVTNAACVPSSCTGNETLLEIIIKENSEDDEDEGEDDNFTFDDDFFGNFTNDDDFSGNSTNDDDFFGNSTNDDDFFGNFTDDFFGNFTNDFDDDGNGYVNDRCELNDFTFEGLQQDDTTVSGDENYEDFVQCFTEASEESFNSLTEASEDFFSSLTNTLGDVSQIGNACEGAGFDMIYSGGKLTCDGDVVADVHHIFSPICLPSACTSNEEVLKTIAGSIIFGDAKDSFEDDQCVEEFTFKHVGPGFVADAALQKCSADFREGTDVNLLSFYTILQIGEMTDEPDYSALPELCTSIEGFDYFTVSGTQTCSDGSINTLVDKPTCVPQSCSSMGENVFSQLLNDSEEDIVCAMSDISFAGIDAPKQTSSASSHGGLVAIILLIASAMTML